MPNSFNPDIVLRQSKCRQCLVREEERDVDVIQDMRRDRVLPD